MKNNFILITVVLIAGYVGGCVNSNVAWRGTINATYQTASTDGNINNKPLHGDATVAAEKATDAKIDIPLTGN